MNNINQMIGVGHLLIRLHRLAGADEKVALIEAECLASPERAEIATLAMRSLLEGKNAPIRHSIRVKMRF